MLQVYKCKKCGNVVLSLVEGGGELVCCGEPMFLMNANTTDAAVEKHVPAVTRTGNHLEVQVGSVAHPMTEEHYIPFVVVEQGCKVQVKNLKPGSEPKACFDVKDGPVTVYEYCNLHGLWKVEA